MLLFVAPALVTAPALAMDTPWDCEVPADLPALVATDFADPSGVWDTAWDAAYAWMDASCIGDCGDEGLPGDCYAASCVTAAGAEITYRRYDYYGDGTETVTDRSLTVRLPADAGEPWTEIALDYSGETGGVSDHLWTASWTGTLVEGWPADETFTATFRGDSWEAGGSGGSSGTTTFAGTGCEWSVSESEGWGDYCWPDWGEEMSATIAGVSGSVRWEPCDACDGLFYLGSYAGVELGTVDPTTGAPTGTLDADGDGFYADTVSPYAWANAVDCDDADPAVHPCVDDARYDGVDSDCDGEDDFDADYDGHASAAYGGDDCDDTRRAVHPGATDAPCDGLDADCDGVDPCGADTGDTGDTAPMPDTADSADTATPDTAPPDTADTAAARPAPVDPGDGAGCGGGGSGGCGGGAGILAAVPLLAARRRAFGRGPPDPGSGRR